MSKLTVLKTRVVKILRNGSEHDYLNFSEYGTTWKYGTLIGQDGDKMIVRFTDSDNKVKIKRFEKDRIQ